MHGDYTHKKLTDVAVTHHVLPSSTTGDCISCKSLHGHSVVSRTWLYQRRVDISSRLRRARKGEDRAEGRELKGSTSAPGVMGMAGHPYIINVREGRRVR
jgi:hypothetical protein